MNPRTCCSLIVFLALFTAPLACLLEKEGEGAQDLFRPIAPGLSDSGQVAESGDATPDESRNDTAPDHTDGVSGHEAAAGSAGGVNDSGYENQAGSGGADAGEPENDSEGGTEAGEADAGESGDDASDAADALDSASEAGCADGATAACYSGPPGTNGIGECHGGARICVNGTWGPCQGEVTPNPETCNWKDDDCNGAIDDVAPSAVQILVNQGNASAPAIVFFSGVLAVSWTRPESGKDKVWFGTADPLSGARILADTLVSTTLANAFSRDSSLAAVSSQSVIAGFIDSSAAVPHAATAEISKTGAVAKSSSFETKGGNAANTSIAQGSSSALVVYDDDGQQSREIFYGLWQGGALTAHGALTQETDPSRYPRVVWTGTQFLVVWQQDPGPKISYRVVSASGAPLGNIFPLAVGDAFNPDAVWTGNAPAVSFRPTGNAEVKLAIMDQSYAVTKAVSVAAAPGSVYHNATLAWGSNSYALVWVEITAGIRKVKASRVKADG